MLATEHRKCLESYLALKAMALTGTTDCHDAGRDFSLEVIACAAVLIADSLTTRNALVESAAELLRRRNAAAGVDPAVARALQDFAAKDFTPTPGE